MAFLTDQLFGFSICTSLPASSVYVEPARAKIARARDTHQTDLRRVMTQAEVWRDAGKCDDIQALQGAWSELEGDLATIFEQCMQARKRPAPRTDSTPAADAAKFSELLTQSREALKRGLYDQAHQLCRQALAIQPKDPHALEVCALAACCVGNAAEAKGYYAMMIGQRQRQSRIHQFCLIKGIELAR